MAKYLFCLPRFHTNIVPWVRVLRDQGHEVAVHVTSVGYTENHSIISPLLVKQNLLLSKIINFSGTPENQISDSPNLKWYFSKLNEENPDVVLVRGLTRWFSRTAAVAAILQRRKLVVYDQEDVIPKSVSTWIRRAGTHFLNIPHVTTRLPEYSSRLKLGHAIPLPFGCSFEQPFSYNRELPPPKQATRILMVAKYRERKQHLYLLSALAELAALGKMFTITLCGEEKTLQDTDFCRSLLNISAELGIGSRISLRNNVEHTKMEDIYAESNIFVLPSIHESAAISPIEAAWSGCAVLVSKDTGTRNYIPPGKDREFDPTSQQDLIQKLDNLLGRKEDALLAGRECYDYISKVASREIILDKFEFLHKGHTQLETEKK